MANEGLIFPQLNERQKDLYLKIVTYRLDDKKTK